MPSQLDSPRSERAIERTMQGFASSLARMTVPQLMELAARQAAELQAQAHQVTSDLLSGYHQSQIDQPVLSTMPELPGASGREHVDRPSRPSSPPSQPAARSTSPRLGRRLARDLARAGLKASARRARAEGRR